MSKVKYFNKPTLLTTNAEAVASKRNRTLHQCLLEKLPDDLVFPVSYNMLHGDTEVRVCLAVGPNGDELQMVWLDMPIESYNRLPEVEVRALG